MVKFYYRKMISPALGEIKRPIADILVQTKNGKWIKFRPFIDSGADISIIPHSVGQYLGFEMEDNIIEFGGVSGKQLPVIIKKMKMRIGDIELEPRIGWALIEEAPPLLGRLDMFDKFNITFKEKDGTVLFDPI